MRYVFHAVLAGLFAVSALTASPSFAQTRPAEQPPAGYLGSVYIDSDGCVFFLIEGAWVARLNANEVPMCGFNPTYPRRAEVELSAPVVSSQGLRVTMSSHSPMRPGTRREGHIVVAPGYRAAWTDGRVNPHRGPQTALGDATMAEVWTNTVPREAVNPINNGPALRGAGPAWVEAGRYPSLAQAQAASAALTGQGVSVSIGQGTVSGQYRVMLGPFANLDLAREGYELAYSAGLSPLRIRN